MADYRDPAVRLLNIVQQLRTQGDQVRNRDAWAAALHLNDSSNEVLFPQLGKVLLLPDQIRSEFDRRGLRQQPILKALPKVEKALSYLHLDGKQMQNVKKFLSDDAVLTLEVAHDQLSEHLPPQDVSDDDLQELLEGIRQVLDQATASSVDDRVKRFVVDGLRRLEQAIIDFRIDGGEAIERLIKCAMGEVLTDPDLAAAHAAREPRVSWFWRAAERAAHLSATASVVIAMMGSASPSVVVEGDVTVEVLNVLRDLPEPPELPPPPGESGEDGGRSPDGNEDPDAANGDDGSPPTGVR